jgi:CRISPR system Cascade subunit CasA
MNSNNTSHIQTDLIMKKQNNLLTDPLLIVQFIDQPETEMTLPELLACLHDENQNVIGFRHLQPYQTHAWYAFLTQLSTIARHFHPDSDLKNSEGWIFMLRSLTKNHGEDAPWMLVNDDLHLSAFMQSPVPENNLNSFKNEATPDAIDVLVLSKNHDVKQRKINYPHPSHWIFALISLQTMQGFSGRDNYGISRMNSGYGNRSCVAYVNNPYVWGERIRKDVVNLLKWREDLCEDFPFPKVDGISLLWLEAWDGSTSLHLEQLDPFYIEICRRLRLANADGQIQCFRKATSKRRIDAESSLGYVGDPWLFVLDQAETNRKESEESSQPKALSVPGTGFSYTLVSDILFRKNGRTRSPVQIASSEGGWCLMQALVRGQGETQGYHERVISIPPKYYDPENSTLLEKICILSQHMVGFATDYQKILRDGLLAFYQGLNDLKGQSKKLDFKNQRPDPWLNRFNKYVDLIFFDHLWQAAENVDNYDLSSWKKALNEHVNALFNDAVKSYGTESACYFKYRAEAERFLHIRLAKIKTK